MSDAAEKSFDCYARPLLTMSGHKGGITNIAYLAAGQRLITAGEDKTIRVWSVRDGKQAGTSMERKKFTSHLTVTSDGRRIITSDKDGRIIIWDAESHQVVEEWMHEAGWPQVDISPDNRLIAFGDRTIVIREMNGGRVKHSIKLGSIALSLRFSPRGDKLACGTMHGPIYLYDVESGRLILEPLEGHVYWVRSVLWSPDGRKLFSGADDKTVRCWNSETGEPIGPAWTAHTDAILSISLSPDGTMLASGSWDHTVRFWDTASGRPTDEVLQHDSPVRAVCFAPSGRFIASGGEGKEVWVWRVPWRNNGDDQTTTATHQPVLSVSANDPTPSSTLFNLPTPTQPQLEILSSDCKNLDHLLQNEFARTYSALELEPHDAQVFDGLESRSTSFPQGCSHTQQYTQCINEAQEDCPSEPHDIFDEGKYLYDTARSYPAPVRSHTWDTWDNFLPHKETASYPPTFRQDTDDFNSFPEPLDLTHYIVKLDNQYREGGSFGDVYKCQYNSPLGVHEVAVKAFRFTFTLEEGGARYFKMLRRELGIWKRLSHANIVPFLGVATGFGMLGALSLVSSWMPNGSLQRFLANHDEELNETHRLKLLSDVANGVQYLHSFSDSPIIHGDLNSNNVLLDADFTARLVDFGYASSVGSIPEVLTYLQRSTGRPGALRWTAPEQVLSEDTYQRTPKGDIYSFGCISLQVLSGKQPWSEVREDAAVILRLAKGEKPGRPESRPMDDRHWDFIQSCLSSVDERPTAEMLVSRLDQFLNSCPQTLSLRDMFEGRIQ